jgi:hypothetical protein
MAVDRLTPLVRAPAGSSRLPDRGYIRFYRSIFEHQLFRPEPFTEREAWTWLLCTAAWKPRRQRLGEHLVELDRGELVGALRFLAEKWGWSRGKVERYLIRLKNDAMIETRTETGITVVRVCNYGIYQGGDDAAETEPRHDRDNRKELKHSRKEEGEEQTGGGLFGTELAEVTPVGPDIHGMFEQWYAIYPKKVDPPDAEKMFTRVLKSVTPAQAQTLFEQIMAGTKAYSAEIAANGTIRKFIKAPAVFMNKGSWKSEIAPPASASVRSNRVSSAIDGIASRLTERDFDEFGS